MASLNPRLVLAIGTERSSTCIHTGGPGSGALKPASVQWSNAVRTGVSSVYRTVCEQDTAHSSGQIAVNTTARAHGHTRITY